MSAQAFVAIALTVALAVVWPQIYPRTLRIVVQDCAATPASGWRQ